VILKRFRIVEKPDKRYKKNALLVLQLLLFFRSILLRAVALLISFGKHRKSIGKAKQTARNISVEHTKCAWYFAIATSKSASGKFGW